MTNEERLREDMLRYKKLAAGALREEAIKRAFAAANQACIGVMTILPEDEREAMEEHLKKSVDQVLNESFEITLGNQKLILKR